MTCGHSASERANAAVEHGQLNRREHVPEHVIADSPSSRVGSPGLEHVALAEQLGRGRAGEHDVAREQAVEHQEAECAAVAPSWGPPSVRMAAT